MAQQQQSSMYQQQSRNGNNLFGSLLANQILNTLRNSGSGSAASSAAAGSAPVTPAAIGGAFTSSAHESPILAQSLMPAAEGGLSSLAATALPAAAAAFGAYRAGRMAQNIDPKGRGMGRGFGEGFREGLKPANLLALGMMGGPLWGGLYGAARSAFGSGKSEAQQQRDNMRGVMQQLGLADQDYKVNGFDIGLEDGKALEGGAYDGRRHRYDVNFGEADAGERVGSMAPIANFIAQAAGHGDSANRRANATGWLVNSGLSDRDAYEQSGLDHDTAYSAVLNNNNLTQEEQMAQLAAIDKSFGIENKNQGKGGREEFGSFFFPDEDEEEAKSKIMIPRRK